MNTTLTQQPYQGRSDIYTDGQTVEAGNTLDRAYDTGSISGGAPSGWGATCERYVIGATNGGCYHYRSFDTGGVNNGSYRGFRTEFEFLLVSETYSANQINTIAISKAYYLPDGVTVGGLGISARNWRLFIGDKAAFGYNVFLFDIGEDDGHDHIVVWPPSVGIVVNTVYKIKIEYDLGAGEIRWWMNDELVTTISREDYIFYTTRDIPPTVAHQIMGGSSSSDGRSVEYLLDNIVWTEFPPPPGSKLYRPAVFAPGIAR